MRAGPDAFDGWHLYEIRRGTIPVRRLPPWWGYHIWDDLDSFNPQSDWLLNYPEAAWWAGPVRPATKVNYVISLSSPKIGLEGIGELSGGVHGGGQQGDRPKFHEIRRYPFVSGWRGRTKFVYVLQRTADGLPNDSASSGEQP